jgi:putative transposase
VAALFAAALPKEFNAAKTIDPRFAGWWEESSKEAYSTELANAAAAFDNYAKSKRRARKGARVGMPGSNRSGRHAWPAFTTGGIRVDADGRHVTLPRLDTIRVHEPTGMLLTRVRARRARIVSTAVRHALPWPAARQKTGLPGCVRVTTAPRTTGPGQEPVVSAVVALLVPASLFRRAVMGLTANAIASMKHPSATVGKPNMRAPSE